MRASHTSSSLTGWQGPTQQLLNAVQLVNVPAPRKEGSPSSFQMISFLIVSIADNHDIQLTNMSLSWKESSTSSF